ncbi:MAG: hypothetical protein AB7U35_04715 [Sphingobium sp.]
MDALLLSFLLCLLTETGGRLPLLARHLRDRHGSAPGVAGGVAISIGLGAILAAWAGSLLAVRLTPEARDLLFALALGASGIFLLLRETASAGPDKRRGGAILSSFASTIFPAMGGSAPILIAGIAAARSDPWMAGAGGWAGSMTAVLLALSGTPIELRGAFPRIAAAMLLLLAALFAAVRAMGLM